MPVKLLQQPQPAIFYDVDGTHKADTCENLKAASKRGELHLGGLAHGCYPGVKMPPKMLPELCVACFWDAHKDQSWGLPMHRNEGIELGYLTRGRLDFIVDGVHYKLKGGDLTITRPWQPHQVGNPLISASRMHWLILDVNVRRPNDPWKWPPWINFAAHDLQKLTQLLSHNEQVVWQGNKQIEKCFEQIAEHIQNAEKPESVQTRLQLYINELLLEVFEMLQTRNIKLNARLSSTHRSVEMFLAGLSEHLEYPWTLESMARHCNLGRSRFSHYCRQITNMTAADYLIHCRIERAKKMLSESNGKTILDIAMACGFESSQYFATCFKKKTGTTPTQYRTDVLSGKQQRNVL
ncbi:MAG TPA: AraC family transcriptional regulator [Anaerohalosphaeraceae bacterium]|nr:AraC family transcriptional regulator [Phycisphaerae bacterium]HOM76228.1 AraC family transcriptional regulator [Anaerohalosphaeraceae bacterium]HPC63964.1 AraC family transcriptional regulator [Anaerohalosphaeraceae bacterium]HPO68769.1 AraC family transcriptional regulator [Anaerohalosphaeraceae bacterium]HRS70375.1 AraC family transcriptional regulator [Anaerohalosphaeraceae bacterium]